MNKSNFFQGCRDLSELRAAYVTLLRKYHPDNGGDLETCKAINLEYERLAKILPARKPEPDNGTYAESQESAKGRKASDIETDEKIRDILYKIVGLSGINIEIVGTWIWCDGNTFPYKDILKSLGFTWSRARKKWHWGTSGAYFKKGHKMTFDQVRAMHGSQFVDNSPSPELA